MSVERMHWTGTGPMVRLGVPHTAEPPRLSRLLCSSTGHAHPILTRKYPMKRMVGMEPVMPDLISAKESIVHASPAKVHIVPRKSRVWLSRLGIISWTCCRTSSSLSPLRQDVFVGRESGVYHWGVEGHWKGLRGRECEVRRDWVDPSLLRG